jgi:hypothetical protein
MASIRLPIHFLQASCVVAAIFRERDSRIVHVISVYLANFTLCLCPINAVAGQEMPMKITQNGKARSVSTERVRRHRERRARGVVRVTSLEVLGRDFTVLKRAGLLPSDDPTLVTEAEFEIALISLLDRMAQRLGLIGPPK